MTMGYKDIRVLITGHTGFKGSWLAAWLKSDGAIVTGLALLPEEGQPSLFDMAAIGEGMTSVIGDIRDQKIVSEVMNEARPEIVFHLAAQPLVRRSYAQPVMTFATNVIGTANVLEAARHCPSVKSIVCVTTDKVYQNQEWVWGYRETDMLGGKDPYSASKACAELVAACYSQTMLNESGIRLATVRGGNVVGGGDWSEDRLVPDLVRAISAEKTIVLRNPGAIRPWQYVLELVRAYLMLGEQLLSGKPDIECPWNFGPERENEISVEVLVRNFINTWGIEIPVTVERSDLIETKILRLDTSKAKALLNWRPSIGIDQTIANTARWYRDFYKGENPQTLVARALEDYRFVRV